MRLIVGLGNPGREHEKQRHNIGFMAVDAIHAAHGFSPWRARFQGQVSEGRLGGEKCLLLKPTTYMNESGRAIGEAARFYKIEAADMLVLHDELDLAPGKVRAKVGGGNAGHNGLRSTSSHVGNDFVRVRIGIGHPGRKELVHRHVLGDFAKADAAWVEPLLEAIADAADHLGSGDTNRFMTAVAEKLRPPEKSESGKPKKAGKLTAKEDKKSSGGGKWAMVDQSMKRQGERANERNDNPASGSKPEHPAPDHPADEGDGTKSGLGAMADQLRTWLSGKAEK